MRNSTQLQKLAVSLTNKDEHGSGPVCEAFLMCQNLVEEGIISSGRVVLFFAGDKRKIIKSHYIIHLGSFW